jgi:protein-tyrosine phosphatase
MIPLKRPENKMRPDLHWIEIPAPGRLAIMARPRAGDWLADEIAGWKAAGIGLVVSLLEAEEVFELGLRQEVELCRRHGMEFMSFPIKDRGVPASIDAAHALARSITGRLEDGTAVAVHCRAGIGRSSLIAACALVCSGYDADAAFALIGKARGLHVPDTEQQREWVASFESVAKTR